MIRPPGRRGAFASAGRSTIARTPVASPSEAQNRERFWLDEGCVGVRVGLDRRGFRAFHPRRVGDEDQGQGASLTKSCAPVSARRSPATSGSSELPAASYRHAPSRPRAADPSPASCAPRGRCASPPGRRVDPPRRPEQVGDGLEGDGIRREARLVARSRSACISGLPALGPRGREPHGFQLLAPDGAALQASAVMASAVASILFMASLPGGPAVPRLRRFRVRRPRSQPCTARRRRRIQASSSARAVRAPGPRGSRAAARWCGDP